MNVINDLLSWLEALPADFAFLLAIPFAVAFAGWLVDKPRPGDRAPRRTPAPPARAPSRDAFRPL